MGVDNDGWGGKLGETFRLYSETMIFDGCGLVFFLTVVRTPASLEVPNASSRQHPQIGER